MSLAAGPTAVVRPPALARAAALAPAAVGACALSLLALVAYGVAGSLGEPELPSLVDFDVFHLAGGLARHGRAADAYHWPTMERLEAALGRGHVGYLPYAYPPAFGLLAAALAVMPEGLAYAAFTAGGFALFAAALFRLSPGGFWPAMLAVSPALLVNVEAGQNGAATAGLAGLAVAAALKGRNGAAGLAAGVLAALKPQAALGPPLALLLERRWGALALAAAAAAALTGLAAAVLGPGVVPAFLDGLAETGRGLAAGRLPFHRMASVYACLRSVGLPGGPALAIHGAAALGAILLAARAGRGAKPQAAAGLALMSAAFVSPYLYDYDLPTVGLGLACALAGPDGPTSPRRSAAASALLALACGVGAAQSLWMGTRLSLGAPLLLALLAATAAEVRRATGKLKGRSASRSPRRAPAAARNSPRRRRRCG